jgi:hypothetical protein
MMQSTISQSRVTLIYRNIGKREKEKGEKEERKNDRNPYFSEQELGEG